MIRTRRVSTLKAGGRIESRGGAQKPDRSEVLALHEETMGAIRQVAEGVVTLTDKVDQISVNVARTDSIESDVQIVKVAYRDLRSTLEPLGVAIHRLGIRNSAHSTTRETV